MDFSFLELPPLVSTDSQKPDFHGAPSSFTAQHKTPQAQTNFIRPFHPLHQIFFIRMIRNSPSGVSTMSFGNIFREVPINLIMQSGTLTIGSRATEHLLSPMSSASNCSCARRGTTQTKANKINNAFS